MQRQKEGWTYDPDDFAEKYTQFYANEDNNSDSPENARHYLADRIETAILDLIRTTEGTIRVLSLGSGPQPLEQFLSTKKTLAGNWHRVQIVTVDIAKITRLLTSFPHVQANGLSLPFADGTFNVVYSNMSADFMPRKVFAEIQRVITHEGLFLANFHHPDLLRRANCQFDELNAEKRQVHQDFRHEKNREVKAQLKATSEELIVQIDALIEILSIVSNHIFYTVDQIVDELRAFFYEDTLHVEAVKNPEITENGWFFVSGRKKHTEESSGETMFVDTI